MPASEAGKGGDRRAKAKELSDLEEDLRWKLPYAKEEDKPAIKAEIMRLQQERVKLGVSCEN